MMHDRHPARTERNVAESDGTLIFNIGRLSGGTKATVDLARKHWKPYLVVQLDKKPRIEDCLEWIEEHGIKILNVAGPRESKSPGVYQQTLVYLRQLLAVSAAQS